MKGNKVVRDGNARPQTWGVNDDVAEATTDSHERSPISHWTLTFLCNVFERVLVMAISRALRLDQDVEKKLHREGFHSTAHEAPGPRAGEHMNAHISKCTTASEAKYIYRWKVCRVIPFKLVNTGGAVPLRVLL